MKEHIAIIGGAGYFGTVLTGQLLERDYQVTVIDRFCNSIEVLSSYQHNERFHFVQGDITEKPNMLSILQNHDIIIPLIAISVQSACDQARES